MKLKSTPPRNQLLSYPTHSRSHRGVFDLQMIKVRVSYRQALSPLSHWQARPCCHTIHPKMQLTICKSIKTFSDRKCLLSTSGLISHDNKGRMPQICRCHTTQTNNAYFQQSLPVWPTSAFAALSIHCRRSSQPPAFSPAHFDAPTTPVSITIYVQTTQAMIETHQNK
jgi:hypothetical protein